MSSTARRWTCANIAVINAQQYEAETGGSDNVARGECPRPDQISRIRQCFMTVAASDIISGREINQRPLVVTRINRGNTQVITIDWILLFYFDVISPLYRPLLDVDDFCKVDLIQRATHSDCVLLHNLTRRSFNVQVSCSVNSVINYDGNVVLLFSL